MQQPATLKKGYSLDCYGGSPRGASSATTSGPRPAKSPALQHSISIVVDLAREPARDDDDQRQTLTTRAGAGRGMASGSGGGIGAGHNNDANEANQAGRADEVEDGHEKQRERSVDHDDQEQSEENDEDQDEENDDDDGDDDNDDDEDDDDDDDDENLSTDLARRVLIVDEAELLVRSRAQSAEPRAAGPQLRTRTSSLAAGWTGAGHASLAMLNSSGELAERGALARLSMRRNTELGAMRQWEPSGHFARLPVSFATEAQSKQHSSELGVQKVSSQQEEQQQPVSIRGRLGEQTKPAQPGASRSRRGNSVQQELRERALIGGNQSEASNTKASWAKRRQSLQHPNLLSPSPLVLSAQQALDEEELRGERQFNKQVRSATKSPDYQLHYQKHQQQHEHQSQAKQRCHSTGGLDGPSQLVIKQRNLLLAQIQSEKLLSGQESSKHSKSITNKSIDCNTSTQQEYCKQRRKRRVSFGAIDPIAPLARLASECARPRRHTHHHHLHLSPLGMARPTSDNRGQPGEPMGKSDSHLELATSAETEPEMQSETTGNRQASHETNKKESASAKLPTSLPSGQEKDDSSRVQSIMANAKLRQEEFARLLEEHEQIVNEINRFETKISGSQTNLQQQNQHQQ